MHFHTWPRWCGMLAAALGIELIIGWLLHIEPMVRILPSSNSVSFNTAVAFVLAGSALTVGDGSAHVRWRRAVAVIVMVGATLVLFEDLFDIALGLDWESLHRTVLDGSPRPGRVAPNTCTALLLLGIALWSHDQQPTSARRLLVAACCCAMVLLIGSGVTGLLLDPTLMFGWYKFNRMAAPTAFGLGLLTLGVYASYRARYADLALSAAHQERHILLNGMLILLGMGMAGALTTFIIFANYQQQSIRDKLHAELVGQTRLAEFMITQSANETGSLITRPLLLALIRKVAASHDPAAHAQLEATLTQLLKQEFTSMSLQWADGEPGIAVGKSVQPVELALALRKPASSELMWSHVGFVYKNTVAVSQASGKVVALLTTERHLTALANLYAPPTDTALSAEVVVCGARADAISCFPSRLHPSPLHLLPAHRRSALPVDAAMAGKSDVRHGTDYRGKKVVAAYSQIGQTGLAVISKVDALELYEPINFLLSRSLMVLALSLAIGVLMLRRMVAPLVKALVTSQTMAKASEARAMHSERRLQSITNNVPALIAFIDRNLVYQFANATYERWFGIPGSKVVGRSPRELLKPDGFTNALPRMQQALAGEIVEFSYRTNSDRPGLPAYVSVSYIPEVDDQGTVVGFNVLAFDATERHEHEQALAHLAYHDSLTELPNRRLFHDRLEQALMRARRHQALTALLYLDIDHFKRINDTLGHDCGDLLLRAFSKRLMQAVRASDTVARLGGDEFTIIMESLHAAGDAAAVAQKILDAVRSPFELDGHIVHVTTSIGIAFSSSADLSVETFLQRSDTALYAAKSSGRNRYALFDEPHKVAAPTARP